MEVGASKIVGSRAVVSAVSDCQIILSDSGDSRAVLCIRTRATHLIVDHGPDRLDELARMEGEGERAISWNSASVVGVLAMSRAIGDI
ncbi:hypothetical protein RND81_11G120400 [Saponaria officinalis]|uniref:PPM-type phosphatase domain-containing protein n=1 Tax=Saponaria officinalis TaxID=3572 RepID=A0AAW1HK18_SAPOF